MQYANHNLHSFIGQYALNATFINVDRVWHQVPPYDVKISKDWPTWFAQAFHDRDGTVTGYKHGGWILNNSPELVTPDCKFMKEWNSWKCPADKTNFVKLNVRWRGQKALARADVMLLERDDGVKMTVYLDGSYFQATVIAGRAYRLSFLLNHYQHDGSFNAKKPQSVVAGGPIEVRATQGFSAPFPRPLQSVTLLLQLPGGDKYRVDREVTTGYYWGNAKFESGEGNPSIPDQYGCVRDTDTGQDISLIKVEVEPMMRSSRVVEPELKISRVQPTQKWLSCSRQSTVALKSTTFYVARFVCHLVQCIHSVRWLHILYVRFGRYGHHRSYGSTAYISHSPSPLFAASAL